MQFIQLGMLGALGALAIPVIIHLMFRQRARQVDLGTIQFLKIVLRDNARKRRLKRWLLLALRLACVAMIALLFARPYLLATEPVEGDRLVVVLLDRSASMGLKGGARPIDGALAEARSRVAQASAGKGTHLEIAMFDREVRPADRPSDFLAAAAEPRASGTNYSAAMAWARDLAARSRSKVKNLHILTDLQRSGLDKGNPVTLPSDLDVHLADFGRAFPKNVAVTSVVVEPKSVRPGESAIVRATVLNASALPVSKLAVRLYLSAGDQPIDQEKTVDLDGDARISVEFALPKLPEGLFRGDVSVDPRDDLPFDDHRYVAFSVAPPAPILVVDGDPGRSPFEAETYFLAAALRLAPVGERYAKSPFNVRTVELGASLPDLTRSKTSAVVLANVEGLPLADANRLAEFVARGGGLLVFTGDRVRPEGVQSLAKVGLGVGEVIGAETATDLPWRLDRWERHPIFLPFEDPEHGDLHRPAFTAITRIKPAADSRVIASFRGGEPALIERSHGRGKVVWFTSSCDRGWGDWPRGRLYLPMVHQMLSYVTGLSEGGPIRQEVAGADRLPGITESDGLVSVTNVDPCESETARCTPREFADHFGFHLPEAPAPASVAAVGANAKAARATQDDRLRADELWPFLALTLVGLMLLENFLANRTAA
jgi:hypothetical protein